MDCTVAKKDLLRLVTRADAVSDKKSTMPVLANVLLETSDSKLAVRATDLYLSVTGTIASDSRRAGSFAVPSRDFLDRVKAMPDGPLTITGDGASVKLSAAGSKRKYTVYALPGAEFPTLPAPKADAPSIALPAKLLATLIACTQFSISPDDTRPNLNSAFLEWDGKIVRMVTTDGHRLTKIEMPFAGSAKSSILLPLKAVLEIRRLAEEEMKRDANASVTMVPSDPNAFFEVEGSSFSVKIVQAIFPSYKQVIPKTSSKIATVPRLALAEALRAVSLASIDRNGTVKLNLGDGMMRIAAEGPSSGDALDEIAIDYDGGAIEVGMNAKYALDILGALESTDVSVGMTEPLDPVVIRPIGKSDEDHVAVIMPCRI